MKIEIHFCSCSTDFCPISSSVLVNAPLFFFILRSKSVSGVTYFIRRLVWSLNVSLNVSATCTMTELRNRTVDPRPPSPPAPKRLKGVAKHLPRQKVNEELGLDFPLDDLRGSQAPTNGQVLRHFSHFLQTAQGECSVEDAAKLAVETVKRCWLGANVKMAHDTTLTNRILALNKTMRLVLFLCSSVH